MRISSSKKLDKFFIDRSSPCDFCPTQFRLRISQPFSKRRAGVLLVTTSSLGVFIMLVSQMIWKSFVLHWWKQIKHHY